MSEKTIKLKEAGVVGTVGFAPVVGELKPFAGQSTVLHLTEKPHSVEISRNASGGVSVSVKVYGATVEEAMATAVAEFQDLDARYPVAPKLPK